MVLSLMVHGVLAFVPLDGSTAVPPPEPEQVVVTLLPEPPPVPEPPPLPEPAVIPPVLPPVALPEPPAPVEAPQPPPKPQVATPAPPPPKVHVKKHPKTIAVSTTASPTTSGPITTHVVTGMVPKRAAPATTGTAVALVRKAPPFELDAYKGAVFGAILAQPRKYPKVARRLGLEGVVAVSFTVTPEGSVADVAVTSSGPHPSLDDEAARLVQASAPFPPPPPGADTPLSFTVAISFTLDKG